MTTGRSLTARLVLVALVWLALLLAIGGWVLASAFRSTVEREFEHRLDALLRGLIAVVEVMPDGSIILSRPLGEPRFDQIYSGWYWQIAAENTLERSRSLWDTKLATHIEPAVHQVRMDRGPQGEPLLVVERDVTLAGQLVHVTVAGDLREVAIEVQRFNLLLFGAMGLLAVGLVVAILLQVRFGLAPLRRLQADLERVKSGATTRLDGDYPQEVAGLAQTMNAVLDHDADLIERARTHVGNLAHGLKTPLSLLQTETDPKAVRAQAQVMTRLIEHHLARATAVAGSGRALGTVVAVRPTLEKLRSALARIHADKNLIIDIAAEDVAFRGERQDLDEILGNLMDNACKWARTRVRARAQLADRRLSLTVEDDGTGMSPAEAEEASRRGARLDEMAPGWGLGLAIVADLVALYGGTVTFGRSELGGLAVTATLPAA